MKKLFGKIILYAILIAMVLEVLVRVFHLYFEYPLVTVSEGNVINYIPGQEGYFVTGNRGMNIGKYRINSSGFNSYHEYTPSDGDFDIALVGDSFIEGLHQDYDNSIGMKVEQMLSNQVTVFEYGFSGYDLADQLHLIHEYKDKMDCMDILFIYLKFENDIKRDNYTVQTWADLDNSGWFYRVKREIKLLSYLRGIGLVSPVRNLPKRIKKAFTSDEEQHQDEYELPTSEDTGDPYSKEKEYLDNLKALLSKFPIDKEKSVFLINKSNTSNYFISYCDSIGYKYLDLGEELKNSKENTVLKYDQLQHWNNHGRDVVAKVIADYVDSLNVDVDLAKGPNPISKNLR